MKRLKKFEDYKYHAEFTAIARCVPDVEKNKFLSLASLEDLKLIIPEGALTDGYQDLLPIAANACVVNLGNKRGDMIATATALDVYKNFGHKFIDIEHDRKIIVGHLVNSGLSKFSSDYKTGVGSEPLKEEAIASSTDPFNISLSGYIYAIAFPDIAKRIIEANDPESEHYLTIALSWELAFDSYKIALGSSQVLSDCEIISDPAEIEKYAPMLKCNKGSGIANDGRNVYRLIDEGVIPLGVALTFAPAGQVGGVYTNVKLESNANDEQPKPVAEVVKKEDNTKKTDENAEKVSQATTANVTSNITNSMKTLKTLADLQNINDENAKEYSFANIGNVLEAEMSRIAKEYQVKIETEANEKAQNKKSADEALASVDELKKKITALEQAQASAEATQKFSDRMQSLDESFELTDDDRKAIANDIKGLDDDNFDKWQNKFSTYASAKKKDAKAAKAAADKAAKDAADKKAEDAKDGGKDDGKEDAAGKKKDAKASDDTEAARIAAEALKNAAAKTTTVANTTETQTSLVDKYRSAFSVGDKGGLEIVKDSRR